ncbi:MAG: hypothetical protein ABH864_04680 [archaeon]
MVIEADFQHAVKHPRSRQRFLNQLDLECARPFITKLVYVSPLRNFLEGGHGPMNHSPGIFNGNISRIMVYPGAFTWRFHHTLNNFLSTLIDHEGHHAYERAIHPETRFYTLALALREPISLISNCLDKPTLKASRFKIGKELRAYQNQLKNSGARRVSQNYEEEIRYRCDFLAGALRETHEARLK